MKKKPVHTVESIQNRIDRLQQEVAKSLSDPKSDAAILLENLNSALEELHVANEELMVQNEQQNQTLQMLEAERRKYRELFEFAPDGYVVTDLDGKIREANHAFINMMKSKPKKVFGSFLLIYLSSREVSEYYKILRRLRANESIQGWDVLMHCRDTDFYASVNAQPVIGSQDHPVALRWMLRDVSGRKAMEEALRTALQQKEILLKEVHHRVNNNLQMVYALLDLQLRDLQDEAAINALKESQGRIKSIAMVHEKLYRTLDMVDLDFGRYAYDLAMSLFRSYGVDSGQVKLQVEIKDILLDVDTALPLGLILNELLSNALKHAFSRQRKGTILVEMKEAETELVMKVSDDGVGFPHDYNRDKPETLGLKLVNLLTSQLEGRLEIRRNHGMEFQIKFQRKSGGGGSEFEFANLLTVCRTRIFICSDDIYDSQNNTSCSRRSPEPGRSIATGPGSRAKRARPLSRAL